MDNTQQNRFKELLAELPLSSQGLPEKLIERQLATPETVNALLSDVLNTPVVDIDGLDIKQEALSLLSEESARHYNVLPLDIVNGRLKVALVDPTDRMLIKELRFITGHDIDAVISSQTVIRKHIEAAYSRRSVVENSTAKNASSSSHHSLKNRIVR